MPQLGVISFLCFFWERNCSQSLFLFSFFFFIFCFFLSPSSFFLSFFSSSSPLSFLPSFFSFFFSFLPSFFFFFPSFLSSFLSLLFLSLSSFCFSSFPPRFVLSVGRKVDTYSKQQVHLLWARSIAPVCTNRHKDYPHCRSVYPGCTRRSVRYDDPQRYTMDQMHSVARSE